MGSLIFCADIGTSSLKAGLIDAEGRESAFIREAYPPDRFAARRIRAGDWEDAFFRAAGRLLRGGAKPAAVCISGNGPTLVPVAQNGEALAPLHWYGEVIAAEPEPAGSAEAPTSQPPTFEALASLAALALPKSFFLPHAAWFRRQRPEEYGNTARLFSAQEWLSFRLGAEAVTVLPAEAYRPYYWDDAQCAEAGIAGELFPPFANLGSIIGTVSSGAGALCGLPPGIPIIAGGPDFIMALLGVGAIKPGIVCDRAGTSEGINVCADRYIKSRELRVLPHLSAGLWNIGGVIADSGRLFEWYRNLTGQNQRKYEEILAELINPDGTLPQDRAQFFPKTGFFGNRLLSPQALGRGVLETLGFQARTIIGVLAREGFPVTEMRVSGGQGGNPRWNQLKADITGCTLLIPEIRDGELAGDAALAAIALGEAPDLPSAVDRIIRIHRRYTPDPQNHARYSEAYQEYCARRDQLERVFP